MNQRIVGTLGTIKDDGQWMGSVKIDTHGALSLYMCTQHTYDHCTNHALTRKIVCQ